VKPSKSCDPLDNLPVQFTAKSALYITFRDDARSIFSLLHETSRDLTFRLRKRDFLRLHAVVRSVTKRDKE